MKLNKDVRLLLHQRRMSINCLRQRTSPANLHYEIKIKINDFQYYVAINEGGAFADSASFNSSISQFSTPPRDMLQEYYKFLVAP
jgi:hypothetical protein